MGDSGLRDIVETAAGLLGPAVCVPVRAGSDAPAGKGAYVLALRLDEPVGLAIGGHTAIIEPGAYVYSGSAYGPGGIRARLSRHLRRDKKLHWHVDRLTLAASAIEALALEAGSECAIVETLSRSAAFIPALAGFGSSDCRTCPTHLLRWLGPRG